ncbi:MAG: hypothetical protein AABZ05_08080 [Nitrospirota bacterium]
MRGWLQRLGLWRGRLKAPIKSIQRARQASVEGEAPSGFAGGGGDASPCNRSARGYHLGIAVLIRHE